MKPQFLRSGLLFFFALFGWQHANSQCTITTGGGTYYGTVYPGCDAYTVTPVDFGPGQYADMPMLIGGSYTINTCGNGTFQGYDTQITVRQSNNNLLGYNDDSNQCGTLTLNSYLDVAGTTNEFVRVGVKRFNCLPGAGGSTSIFVRFRQNNNLDWASTATSACEGSTVALAATPAPNATTLGTSDKGTYTGTGVAGTTWTAPSVSVNTDYTINYAFGACQISQTITSLAFPNAVATITGSATPCEGVVTIYTASTSANATSYEWILPSGWTGTSITSTISVTPNTTAGTIQVRGVNACGDGPWTTLAVTPVDPVLTATNNSPTICSGDATSIDLLSSELGSTFTWTTAVTGTVTGASDVSGFAGNEIVQTLTNAGAVQGSVTYTIYASALGCDGDPQTITVNVDPAPNGALSGDATICEGDTTFALINFTAGTGPFDVNISDGNITIVLNGISDGQILPVAPTVTTTYTITSITDALGCNSTSGFGSSVTITVNEAPDGDMSVLTPICLGDQTTLTFNFTAGTAPYNITYTDGISTFTETGISSGASVVHVPSTTVTYNYVSIEDANGCVSTGPFAGNAQVNVNPLPNVSFSGLNSNYCESEGPVTITGNQAPNGTFTGTAVTDNGDGTATFDPSLVGVGTYSITYAFTDINTCSADETQSVSVDEQPVANAGSGGDECDLDFTFSAVASVGVGTWTMTSGPGTPFYSNPNGPTSGIVVSDYGTYVFEWMEESGVCADAASITVNFYEQPVADPGTGGNECSLSYTFNGAASVGTGTWTFTGPGNATFAPSANDVNATATVDATGSYTFTWTEDNNGCVDAQDVIVDFIELTPPVITPNGNVELCDGSTLTLDAGPGYATYDWNGMGVNQTLDVTTAGSYTVTVSNAEGCVATSDPTVVTINALPIVDLGPDTTICVGASVVLDAGNAGSTYMWSTSEATQTIIAAITDNYSVMVTDANGCSASDDITVQIQGNLTPVIIPIGSPEFCAGDSVVLDAGAGFTGFQWNTGATDQTITVSQDGIYEVIVQDQFGCSGVANPFQVTVWQLPNAVIIPDGPTDICAGETVTLAASNTFADYSWTPNGEITNSIDVSQTGAFTVTVIDPVNGCENVSDTTFVTVHTPQVPVITVSGATEFCVGGDVVLDAGSGFSSYLWTSGSTTQSINVTQTGDYSVIILDAYNCIDSSLLPDPIHVEVWDPQPIAMQQGDSLVANGGPFASYQWFQDGAPIPGATGQVYNPTVSGNYTVQVFDENGCEAESNEVAFGFIGIADIGNTYGINVYPNPNKGQFTVEATFDVPSDVNVVITDALGKTARTFIFNRVTTINQPIDLNQLPNGVYQLRLSTDNAVVTKRILKI